MPFLDNDDSLAASTARRDGMANGVMPVARGRREVARLELEGRMCRLLQIDDALSAPRDADADAFDTDEEIVHFGLGAHRYVLVARRPILPHPLPHADAEPAPQMPRDISRLLSGREMEVVHLVCMGYLTKQIADRMRISEFTVRSYLKTIYAKLGVRSRAALVFRFMKAFQGDTPTRS
ncbi:MULTISPECIES: helix-turn-helix transcriptional regulator [Caballeronia]|jgi:DNA-binding CsgD family transcriptional regulator|uniref:Helix-turn-helix transcriptional regulator n=1 Tax=Caballeronia jiangsuensis TaxID=1458357 RepID=A0ABW9D0E4_9BURK|nr:MULTISPECIES: helix-turn-helix transcriptional regulator [Caballeronia]GJH08507.1 response regulator transcription factor [Caballeronia novacaledonica]